MHGTPGPRIAVAAVLLAAAAAAVTLLVSRPHAPDSGREAAGASANAPVQSVAEEPQPLRYDVEYPAIGYSSRPPADRIAALRAKLETGAASLAAAPEHGYLRSLLDALDIDPASQVLVFSATSLQVGSIRPRAPRAIYFNDEVYVAWVQGAGPIEIASMDPHLGPVFYTLEQDGPVEIERQMERCLRCHDSFSLTGGGVPRFIVGSGYIDSRGNIAAHEGWIITTQRTPLRNRFGGWYVTGRHGDQVHLGNIIVRDLANLGDLESLRNGNLDSLQGLVDTTPYLMPGSDIVALLVMQHQVDVQNEIARVGYEVRSASHDATSGSDTGDAALRASTAESVEPLVEAMLFVGEAEITAPITGSSDFRRRFEQRGPRDAAGRSLRELDLSTRLLRYPLSYLVYSSAFDGLPDAARDAVYRRLAQVLRGEDRSGRFDHLASEDRAAVLEILIETKPEFAALLAEIPPAETSPAASPAASPTANSAASPAANSAAGPAANSAAAPAASPASNSTSSRASSR